VVEHALDRVLHRRIRVTSGGPLNIDATREVGDALRPQQRYRFDLRGWDGVFGPPAIVAAEPSADTPSP
jgi:hypothetical protein